jgi:TonB family protein
MLQPLQLDDVSVRYAREIAELRDFLVKAGAEVDTPDALGTIVARLPQDRSFRRDLTSYVWVVIHGGKREISYPDLLGVLALAAAGTRFAAAADEDDAHNLLRFLMEARRALETIPEKRETVPLAVAAEPKAPLSIQPVEPSQVAPDADHKIFDVSPRSSTPKFLLTEVPETNEGGKRRLLWLLAAACVLVTLALTVWLVHRSRVEVGNVPAAGVPAANPVTDGTLGSPTPSARSGDNSINSGEIEAAPTAIASSPTAPRDTHIQPSGSKVQSSLPTPTPAPYIPFTPAASPQQAPAAGAHGPAAATQAVGSAAIPASVPRPSGSTASVAPSRPAGSGRVPAVGIPATTLSKHLDSPTFPAGYLDQGDENAATRRPRLLRRHPSSPSSSFSEDGGNLVADVRPGNGSALPGADRGGNGGVSSGGTVRPTSLGIMASYVLYSPAPGYPAAASAAHVQGEVTVRADVDREGKVASARVISGPPLLRDAALDAVQHWRYRPYISSGKPMPMTATAVVDFQLP